MKPQHNISKSTQAEDSDSSVYSGLEDEDESSNSESEKEVEDSLVETSNVDNLNCPNGETSKQVVVDEYEEDTSDEEDIRNTVGNIPMKWYHEFPHIGYDIEGNKLMKPAAIDDIDEYLNKIDDPNYWRTVRNPMTGERVVLTDEELNIIRNIQAGKFATNEDQYQPWEDFFTYEVMEHPVTNAPPHKRSFIPSKKEKEMVSKLVNAIKMGWLKPRIPQKKKDKFYLMWDHTDDGKRVHNYIPAPKRKLPGHEESYNPPPEYLFTAAEEETWKEQEPEERRMNFIPRKFSSLREVPSYSEYIQEWFQRCLDLYLCPRQRKMRVNVDPNDLIPELPKPKDLLPFPTTLSMVYTGHSALVRCISVEPSGQFFASASDDATIKIWEVVTGRCLSTINLGGVVKRLTWCPNEALSLILAAVDEKVFIINPTVGDKIVIRNTDALMAALPENPDDKVAHWMLPSEEQKKIGVRLIISHDKEVKQVVWHAKGDYIAVLLLRAGVQAIVFHQLSKFSSQKPFQKIKGNIQNVLFHPLRPFFFVATQKFVKVYNLLKRETSKVLSGNCKWISSFAVHPQGDNLIVGSYDSRLNWLDMELSTKPYKTLRNHKKAIRQVAFHKRYPLFASSSDDGSVIIYHGMVYSDLLLNPMIIPVKTLQGHGVSLDCMFHPHRPWIFSTSDDVIRLYS